MSWLFLFMSLSLPDGLREVSATSCQVVRINLSPGQTTQLVFEQAPVSSLHADETHFKVHTDEAAPRSIAIIPHIERTTISRLFPGESSVDGPKIPSQAELIRRLDQHLRTNLFVFFRRSGQSSQLMFELRFVDKSRADYIVHVKQEFTKECRL